MSDCSSGSDVERYCRYVRGIQVKVEVDQPRVERIIVETVARCRRFSRKKRKAEVARAQRRLATCVRVVY